MEKMILGIENQPSASSWTLWTHVFTVVDGAARITYSQVHNEKVREALKIMHVALKSVNREFLNVIDAIGKGEEIPPVILPPSEIEDEWDEGVSGGIIETLKSSLAILMEELEKRIAQSETMQKVMHALGGLMSAFDEYMKESNRADEIFVSCL